MDGARSAEPPRARKDDSAISMASRPPPAAAADDDDAPCATPPADVPPALQPGHQANRVVQTGKGLWSAPQR